MLTRYIVRRLLVGLAQLAGLTVAVFFLIRLLPADPASRLVGMNPSPAAYAQAEHTLGLDRPLLAQLASYLGFTPASGAGGGSCGFGGGLTTCPSALIPKKQNAAAIATTPERTLHFLINRPFLQQVVGRLCKLYRKLQRYMGEPPSVPTAALPSRFRVSLEGCPPLALFPNNPSTRSTP